MAFLEGVPTVEIRLDKTRQLGFTMGAMKRIRDVAGTLELPIVDGKIPLDKALELMPVYIWACLDAQDRDEVSVEQLLEFLHPGNMAEISDAIVRLFKRSNPEASADADPIPAGPRLEAAG